MPRRRPTLPGLLIPVLLASAVWAGCASTAYTPEPSPSSAAPTAPSPSLVPSPSASADAPTPSAPTAAATAAPSPAVATPESDAPYDPNDAMWRIYSGLGHEPQTTLDAVADAVAANDVSQAPVIVEVLRFWGGGAINEAYRAALEQFTGQDFWPDAQSWGARPWYAAMEWLGPRRAEFAPPSDYPQWKANLLAIIDPRMAAFLTSVPGSERIDLTEIAWGGVRTDGIPDLRSPSTLAASEADYLDPRDRVFGVSINGEHRAYPLRIMNPHEMANDVLGGEPIALAY